MHENYMLMAALKRSMKRIFVLNTFANSYVGCLNNWCANFIIHEKEESQSEWDVYLNDDMEAESRLLCERISLSKKSLFTRLKSRHC